MTTALSLINQTHRMLLAGTKEELNEFSSWGNNSATLMNFSYDLRGIQPGAVLGIDTELMYVVSVNEGMKQATVMRGYEGTTSATHDAYSIVTVNPKFAKVAIFDAMNDTLDDLSGEGLFQITTIEQTYNPAINGYDLTGITALEGVHQVTVKDPGAAKDWPRIPSREWEVRRNTETDDFSTGFALITRGGGSPGRQLRIECKVPFARATATSDDVNTTCGLPATANDLLKYGAAMKLVYWRETMRNVFENQGDSRRAEEVPAGANIGAARAWQAIYNNRLRTELERLQRQYPSPVY